MPWRAARLRARDHFAALLEEYAQVLVVDSLRFGVSPTRRVGLDVGDQLDVLRDERRFVGFQRRVEAQQLGFHAESGGPVRNDAQRAQDFGERSRQRRVRRELVEAQRADQREPGVVADTDHPPAVTGAVKNAAQEAAQQLRVEFFGKQFMADAAEYFAEEPGVGQDPGRRVELGMAAALLQREQRVADVGAQLGVAAEDEAQRLQRAPRSFDVVGAARSDLVDQPGEQVGRVGVRCGKAGEQLFHRILSFGERCRLPS